MNDTRYDLEIEKWMIRLVVFSGFLWVLFVTFAVNAEPLRFEAQVGQCQHTKAEDGVWWSSHYPTNMDMKSSCWNLGVSRAEGDWKGNPYGWRIAYVDLGRVKGDNVFTVTEPQYPGETGESCNSQTGAGCLARGRMYQRTRGVSFGGFLEGPVTPEFTLGVEGGAYIYYSRFEVWNTSLPKEGQFASHLTWGDILFSPYVGMTAKYGILFATLRTYTMIEAHEHKCRGCTGMTDHAAYQATIGIQIPIK